MCPRIVSKHTGIKTPQNNNNVEDEPLDPNEYDQQKFPLKPYVGHHINTEHGFISSADYATKIGANFFQIFLSSPQSYNGTRHSDYEMGALRTKLRQNDTKIVVHGSFLMNFCNPVTTGTYKQAVTLLVKDLNDSIKVGAIGVVIHMGKRLTLTVNEATNNYVSGIKEALTKSHKESIIILETGAGVGTEICTDLFDLHSLYAKFSEQEQKRIMFCLDTCHMFAAGYDMGDIEYMNMMEELIDTLFSWPKIACVHFNDSKCPINSKKDRHADIGKGLISTEGLKQFYHICIRRGVPVVLETPCDNGAEFTRDKQIRLLRSWLL